MTFKEFMILYDDWNGITKVNDDDLNPIIIGNTYEIMTTREDLFNKKVVAFGFYDDMLTVRVK